MKKFLSRKFLLTVAGLATLAANKQWTEFSAVLIGYLGVNFVSSKIQSK